MYRLTKKILFFCLFALSLSACSDNEAGLAKLKVKLIDAPADYDKVIIDVKDVLVKSEEGDWVSLDEVEKTRYDLLELTNGNSVLLGEADLPAGRLSQIRLVLGSNNDLVIDGTTYNLTVPSGSTSGLKINVQTDLEAGITYTLVLDFDAGKSVVEAGNSGKYNLKPVIRAEMEALTGALAGTLSPFDDMQAVVYAISSANDTISSYPSSTGDFLVGALEQGTYKVVVEPSEASGKSNIVRENINVSIGEVTQLGTLQFD